MAERIIPIQIEQEETHDENVIRLSEPMEQLVIEQGPVPVQIQEDEIEENDDVEKYFKEFDLFEGRNEYSLISANVPEKIILIIDRAQDEKCTPFLTEKSKFSPLSMLRRIVKLFLKLKHMINADHEFALMVLNENDSSWQCDFTRDPKKLNYNIDRIKQCDVEDSFSLNSLFTEISNHVQLPDFDNQLPPRYIIRPIILYGRSYTIPALESNAEISKLLNNPYFVVDTLFTHEPVDRSNNCNKISECLQKIDQKGLSYFLPVGRDTSRLHKSMAKLLGHPLQRPVQKLQKI
ncbi:BRISC and BRCA1-A complex member 1 [Leptinotarsa decemlineata]|uniref:BRISC and BRCA1-A complex member 1 n=1 Tax=Leptinotarsa decemlineata TaxID=7539 RepID=UPI000C251B78|nr:BRISC and BRCA1-A complex member 1-like [Leptinotarsa decemlineata]